MTERGEIEIRRLEQRYGIPRRMALSFTLDHAEMETVAGSMRKGRDHDITLFIVCGDRVVAIRKPWFSAGAYRAPSGGAQDGEGLEEGGTREALEETGLTVALDRYLLRIAAVFRPCGTWTGYRDIPPRLLDPAEPTALRWTSHVFSAHPENCSGAGELHPLDTREIAEARWVTIEELQGPIREVLLGTGRGLFRYRVALTDAAVDALAS